MALAAGGSLGRSGGSTAVSSAAAPKLRGPHENQEEPVISGAMFCPRMSRLSLQFATSAALVAQSLKSLRSPNAVTADNLLYIKCRRVTRFTKLHYSRV